MTLKYLSWSRERCLVGHLCYLGKRGGPPAEDVMVETADRQRPGDCPAGSPQCALPLTLASDAQGIFPLVPRQALEGWAQEPWESTGVFPVWALDLHLDK